MKQTRRRYLAATGAVTVGTGVAGCLGGGGSGAADTSHSCELTDRDPVDELPQPTVGSDEAAVTVDLFEDFACPHCADFATDDLVRLEEEYAGDEVRFRRFDFLVVNSDWNEPVANAARSVQKELGDEAFFEFARAAYESQSEYSWQVIGDLAESVGDDPCRVLSDANGGTYDGVLQADQTAGEDLGVPGTPGAVVDGQLLEGAASYDTVSSAIDASL
ncbi:DsbA family protein [Halohasta litorea]|uniref:DsbA family protein n=1 Tax=Halohasta litorea TaxID=869891 RepID=A0ABD6D6U8_9EURY|nr:thioredoxin domain-containing protein [Halohasta litorea]